MDTLLRDGVVVLDGPSLILKADPLKEFLIQQVEFTTQTPPSGFVVGGFGALCNPSSFHHPSIRTIVDFVSKHFWKDFANTFPQRKLEVLFDSFCIRRKGTKTNNESWHRDLCTEKLSDDIILGGWINLDPIGSPPHKFSCVPKTHNDIIEKNTGYTKLKNTEEYKKNKVIYDIHPGQVVFFFQNLVHEVIAREAKFDSYRLYMGWRITDSNEPLFDHEKIIENQGVPRNPSGQTPRAYYKNHLRFFKDRIKEHSECVKSGALDKDKFVSLRESRLSMFRPYTKAELEIRQPRLLI